jgi:adhesin transport system outer membrane protein
MPLGLDFLKRGSALRMFLGLGLIVLVSAGQSAHAQPAGLPLPAPDPLAIDMDADPLLAIERQDGGLELFRQRLQSAAQASPAIAEAEARNLEAVAGRRLAKSGQLPAGELSISSFRTLSREFSNDPQNIIERSRARQRTDALISLTQPLVDFGASGDRIAAAEERVTSSEARFTGVAEDVGLRAISAWYDLFAARTLVSLGEALDSSHVALGEAIDQRIAQGVSARSDRVRIDGTIAAARARLAGFRRSEAGALARFTELLGPPPERIQRAPLPLPIRVPDAESVAEAIDSTPAVRAVEAEAKASRRDAEALRADLFPTISASVDAGRYGVFETDIDYDVRARLNVRLRLFGGGDARADQASARAMADDARADRVRDEALREASIAASDVRALEEQLVALRNNYVAARISRDVLTERFRVARGSLFDVMSAEDAFFATATAYIQGIVDLDLARYVLLARTGGLLPALGLDRLSPTTWEAIR